MESMMSLYNIARDKQKVQQNEFNPHASATGAILQGIAGGMQERKERPSREAELMLKLMEISAKQGEIKAQEQMMQQKQEAHQQLFGNLNTSKTKSLVDKYGKPINTFEGNFGGFEKTHDKTIKWDADKGVQIELKPKKGAKDKQNELDMYSKKKEIELQLKQKYGKVDTNALALEINRLTEPYKDFGKEVNWTKMQAENPNLYKTVMMLYEAHDKLARKKFNPDDPMGIGDIDLEE